MVRHWLISNFVGSIPSSSPKEIFLSRLLEADSIASLEGSGTDGFIDEGLANRCSSTEKLMKLLEDAITAERLRTYSIAQSLSAQVTAEGLIILVLIMNKPSLKHYFFSDLLWVIFLWVVLVIFLKLMYHWSLLLSSWWCQMLRNCCPRLMIWWRKRQKICMKPLKLSTRDITNTMTGFILMPEIMKRISRKFYVLKVYD